MCFPIEEQRRFPRSASYGYPPKQLVLMFLSGELIQSALTRAGSVDGKTLGALRPFRMKAEVMKSLKECATSFDETASTPHSIPRQEAFLGASSSPLMKSLAVGSIRDVALIFQKKKKRMSSSEC